jgi:hypothetical protein
MEAVMRLTWAIAAAAGGFVAVAALAADPTKRAGTDQTKPPIAPPASGTSSSDLGRSGGVITPPLSVDPQMKRTPPPAGDNMPVIPPPGTPGGDPSIKPK